MPTSDAENKTERLQRLQLLFWHNRSKRYRTRDLAAFLGVSDDAASDYVKELSSSGRLPLQKDGWYWYLPQGARLELLPLHLTLSEAASLHLAGCLLALTQNKRNDHVLSALTKLVGVMPETIAPHQHALIKTLQERQRGQEEVSSIFETLTVGWATQRIVRLSYRPPHKRRFECRFAPYLLEPSGIGRTIYAIGRSSTTPTNEFRTYKLERIESAGLTEEPFVIPADFDGPTLLKHAWGVMYGDEQPIEVHLRFSHYVAQRVKETIWHPSQETADTPEGCEWIAQIGDTVEIENWIRGWGSDCEVLAPDSLRETILDDLRRSARLYGLSLEISTDQMFPEDPDDELLRGLL